MLLPAYVCIHAHLYYQNLLLLALGINKAADCQSCAETLSPQPARSQLSDFDTILTDQEQLVQRLHNTLNVPVGRLFAVGLTRDQPLAVNHMMMACMPGEFDCTPAAPFSMMTSAKLLSYFLMTRQKSVPLMVAPLY